MHQLLQLLADYKIDTSALPHVTANAARLQVVMTVAFSVIGAVALLFLTIGGFRYVASQGDPKAAALAKNTILYSVIGLVVSVSAVAIISFILGRV